MLSSLAENTRSNSASFPGLTWEQDHFLCLSTFQTLESVSKNISANSLRFIGDSKKGPLNKCGESH